MCDPSIHQVDAACLLVKSSCRTIGCMGLANYGVAREEVTTVVYEHQELVPPWNFCSRLHIFGTHHSNICIAMCVLRDADSEFQGTQWDGARTDCTKWFTTFFGQQVQIRCCYYIFSTIGVLFSQLVIHSWKTGPKFLSVLCTNKWSALSWPLFPTPLKKRKHQIKHARWKHIFQVQHFTVRVVRSIANLCHFGRQGSTPNDFFFCLPSLIFCKVALPKYKGWRGCLDWPGRSHRVWGANNSENTALVLFGCTLCENLHCPQPLSISLYYTSLEREDMKANAMYRTCSGLQEEVTHTVWIV